MPDRCFQPMSMIDKVHLRIKCTVAFRKGVVLAVKVMGGRRTLKIPNQRKNLRVR